jgi:hypothetical protein
LTSPLDSLRHVGFDTGDYWSLIPQIVCIVALIWFAFHTGRVFYKETKTPEARKQGAVHVLAFLYMGLSAYYILYFILNFGELRSFNEFKLRNSLFPNDDPYWYVLFINLLTSFILIAFTLNFSKALLTLTSLEFGTVSSLKLSKLFGSPVGNWDKFKPYAEAILRLFIALFFVLTEEKLVTPKAEINSTIAPNVKGYAFNSFLFSLSGLSLLLYSFLLVWLVAVYYWLGGKGQLPLSWYKSLLWQFIAGIIVALFLGLFGWNNMGEGYKISLTVSLVIGIVAAIAIISSIILNECRRLSARASADGHT